MARSYIVQTLYTNSDDGLLYSMDWTYGDPLEPVNSGGKHDLTEGARQDPTGLTQQQLVEILVADLPNTTEQFDATLDQQLAAIAEEEAIVETPGSAVPVHITANVVDATAPSDNFKWEDINDPTFISLQVGAVIISSDGIPAGATCLTKDEAQGVTTWSESTTVSGSDVPFTIVYENP